MSTSYPDALPPSPLSQFNDSPCSSEFSHSSEGAPLLIRTVRQTDLLALADVLASSFHTQMGWIGWFYPLLKVGIYEDLKSRLQTRGKHYACLAAVQPGSKTASFPAALVEQSPSAALSLAMDRSDQILGTVEIALKPPSLFQPWEGQHLYLSNLAVRTDCRRRGIAQRLLQTCDQVALSWGFSDLYLHVLENNDPAQRLYQRAGYQVRRTEVNPLSVLLGQPRQLFMHKRLK